MKNLQGRYLFFSWCHAGSEWWVSLLKVTQLIPCRAGNEARYNALTSQNTTVITEFSMLSQNTASDGFFRSSLFELHIQSCHYRPLYTYTKQQTLFDDKLECHKDTRSYTHIGLHLFSVDVSQSDITRFLNSDTGF